MPTYFPTAPQGGAEIIGEHLAAPAGGRRPGVVAESESTTQPAGQHQIFVVPAEAALRGELLAAAQPVGCVISSSMPPMRLLPPSCPRTREAKLAFAQRNDGPFVEATIDAIRTAEGRDTTQQAAYEAGFSAYRQLIWSPCGCAANPTISCSR
jgi:hypothetical protein